jgi:fructokinase
MVRGEGRWPGGAPAVLVVGEALVDVFTDRSAGSGNSATPAPPGQLALRAVPGGGPANIAVGLGRLGVKVAFAGRFSSGGFGPWRRRRLGEEGVDLSPSVTTDRSTTLAVVTLDAGGAAAYDFYGPETADWWWAVGELPAPADMAGSAVQVGSLVAAMEPGAAAVAEWVGRLRASGSVAVTYDPNVRPAMVGGPERCREAAKPFVDAAHLIKVSREDLDVLAPGAGPAEAASAWFGAQDGPSVVVVTSGAEGAIAYHRDGRSWARPSPPVDVVDTVGAGDAFAAGLLGWLAGHGLLTPAGLAGVTDDAVVAALDQANRVAAVTCARAGADPPTRAQLDAG